jgi:hypothetical protein
MAIIKERMTVDNESDIVVFLIGMRINKLWKFWQWLPVAIAMPRMLIELGKHPEMGMLEARTYFGFPNIMVLQYWRSFEDLVTYAGNKNAAHLPAWRDFNRRISSNGDVGIWHETYRVPVGNYEAFYNNMPAYGLGKVLELVPASGHRTSAVARMRAEKRKA